MSDMKFLVRAAERLRRAGDPFLVATVVRVRGSSYRRPGARMLLTPERWVAGSVSGGCLEGDVVKRGWWLTRETAALVTYDATAQDEVRWGFGLGCDGIVDVLLERAGGEGRVDPLAFFDQRLRSQSRGVVATVFRGAVPGVSLGARVAIAHDETQADPMAARVRDQLVDKCREALASGDTDAFEAGVDGSFDALVEPVMPPARLFVCGAGHDAAPVVRIASTVGWEVIVCDARARFASRQSFADADEIIAIRAPVLVERVNAADCAVAVVMAHDYEADRDCLGALLSSRVRYIGVLGPRRRTERLLGELGASGDDPRVHAPVGLALGAETPQEIALAIVAEVQGVLGRGSAMSLGTLRRPIHPTASVAE